MTKKEVMTRILEEGKRVFECGCSFTVNGMLLVNYYESAEIRFVYEGDTDIIGMVCMFCDGRPVLCFNANAIEKIYVSENWIMRPGIGDTVFGKVNGERFSCK